MLEEMSDTKEKETFTIYLEYFDSMIANMNKEKDEIDRMFAMTFQEFTQSFINSYSSLRLESYKNKLMEWEAEIISIWANQDGIDKAALETKLFGSLDRS